MNKKPIFILTRNGAVELASKELKMLYFILQKMAAAIGQPCALSYVQVSRIVNEHGTFVHQWAAGQSFEIITRELLYTRRKKANGNTTPPQLINQQ